MRTRLLSRVLPVLSVLSLALASSACRSTPADGAPPLRGSDYAPPPDMGDRPIYLGTELAQQRVRERLDAAAEADDTERQRIAIELVRLGEPAVAPLIVALGHPEPSVRTLAAYVLGQLRDARAWNALAERLEDPAVGVRHEAATALLRNGDRRGVDVLLPALEDEDSLVRARAIQVLEEVTGETFGFVPNARPEDRDAAVSRWKAWRARTAAARS